MAYSAFMQALQGNSLVQLGPEGRLLHTADGDGDVIPDFSWCGYMGGGIAIPELPVRVTLDPAPTGDDGERIQAALDQVGTMAADDQGRRGALLLRRGAWRVERSLAIPAGVVLRGEGQDADGTVVYATGTNRRTLISLNGTGRRTNLQETSQAILEPRVPIGALRVAVANPRVFLVGQTVLINRPATEAWIHHIGMDRIPKPVDRPVVQWNTKDYGLSFARTVIALDDKGITFDVPLVQALEQDFGGGEVLAYQPGSPLTQAGVERLRLVSAYRQGAEKSDEDHASYGVEFGYAKDCWLREVSALHFWMGCVNAKTHSQRITVQDCAALDPASQITGGRRYSFTVDGLQVLVQRCYSRNGRHDFVTGGRFGGPNAFVDCISERCANDSGPHQRWAVGILYDNIVTRQLNVKDAANGGTGQGWTGASHVFWNCNASIILQQPPGAKNWAIGCTGTKGTPPWPRPGPDESWTMPRPDGTWESWGTPVQPRSLYQQQLFDRLGSNAVLAVTTPEQRTGAISEILKQRYGGEPEYPGMSVPD